MSIDDPVSGTTFLVPPGGAADVVVSGSASVGAGVALKDTTVVYVVDLSDSMNQAAGVDCDGVPGNDTRFVCEKEAVVTANDAAKGTTSAIGQTGLASFEGVFASDTCISTAHDVDLGAGTELLVAPTHDGNGNLTADIEEVAQGLATGGSTCYIGGLERADQILAESTSSLNLIFFMSDGINNTGAAISTFSPANFGTNTVINAFALGDPATVSCTTDTFGLGDLNDVAALSTHQEDPDGSPPGPGTCEQVTDLSQIADRILESLGSTLESLTIEVDGGGQNLIPTTDIDIALPANGGFAPKTANYVTTVAGLAPGDHEICVTANGSDAGGAGSVTACITIHVVIEIDIDIKPNSDPNSIASTSQGKIPVAILGSAGFDVTQVDTGSLSFGVTGDEDSLFRCGGLEDVNGDGFPDLVCHFFTQATGFTVGDTVGILKGMTLGGDPFQGTDAVRIVK